MSARQQEARTWSRSQDLNLGPLTPVRGLPDCGFTTTQSVPPVQFFLELVHNPLCGLPSSHPCYWGRKAQSSVGRFLSSISRGLPGRQHAALPPAADRKWRSEHQHPVQCCTPEGISAGDPHGSCLISPHQGNGFDSFSKQLLLSRTWSSPCLGTLACDQPDSHCLLRRLVWENHRALARAPPALPACPEWACFGRCCPLWWQAGAGHAWTPSSEQPEALQESAFGGGVRRCEPEEPSSRAAASPHLCTVACRY